MRPYKMLFIFSSLLLFLDANAIEISFSAEDAGESVSIFNDYDAGNGIAISEDAKAKFGCLEMIDNRIVEGTGDVNMIQNMAGSGGYTGRALSEPLHLPVELRTMHICIRPIFSFIKRQLYRVA